MRALALSAALILTPFTNATTQQDSLPLAPGQRVRITAPSLNVSKLQTTLLEFRADTLVTEALVCPLADVTRLDAYQGRGISGGNVLKGAGIGLLGGAAVGALIGLAYDAEGSDASAEQAVAFFSGLGAAVGLVGGTLVGLVWRADRWEEVPLDHLPVSVVAQRAAFGIGARITF
jgi:hypothetical protein